MFTAPEGMIYRNKLNDIMAKILIIGTNDSIDNYELISEPEEPEEDEEDVESNISV